MILFLLFVCRGEGVEGRKRRGEMGKGKGERERRKEKGERRKKVENEG